MMSEVVFLNGDDNVAYRKGEPRSDLIELLERLLADARSGQLQSLVATGFMADGFRLAVWADFHPNYFEMVGAISELLDEFRERKSFARE
jgi:hypothetical protein